MKRNFKILLLLLTSSLSFVLDLGAQSEAEKALEDKIQSQIKSVESVQGDLSGKSDKEIIALAQNMHSHGWAVLDRIRNQTDFPVDIFFNKTLHDLLPPNTIVRIKSKKSDYLEFYTDEELKEIEKQEEEEDQKEQGSRRRRRPRPSSKDKKESTSKRVVNDEDDDYDDGPEIKSDFRYLAARNIAGNWRLVADTTDPEDPATRFIVRKHLMADSDLSTFLGFESEVAPKMMLRAKPNNEIILSSKSTVDFIKEQGKKSTDNFSSDFDIDSHWLLHAKGLKPGDSIDSTQGQFLDQCSLKNQRLDAFLSVRDQTDQLVISEYEQPDLYWYWVNHSKGRTEIRWHRSGRNDEDKDVDYYKFSLNKAKIDRDNLIPSGSLKSMFSRGFGNYSTSTSHSWGGHGNDLGGAIGVHNWELKPPYKPKDNMAEFGSFAHKDLNAYEKTPTKGETSYPVDKMDIGFEEAMMYYHHAEHHGDQNIINKVRDGLFGFRDSVKDKLLSKRNNIKYGDKIRLVSEDSLKVLYSLDTAYESKGGAEAFQVFGSHSDTAQEYDKFNQIDSSKFKKSEDDAKDEKDDWSWWYIKGPHSSNDRWNAEIGMPVQDGDAIRLEHVSTGRNLHCFKTEKPQPSSSGDVDDTYSFLIGTFQGKSAGIGNSDDNFIISFIDPEESYLNKGQSFSLVHQNTKYKIVGENEDYPFDNNVNFRRVVALAGNLGDVTASWFVMAQESGSMPVVDVAWTGVPDGVSEEEIGDKEKLEIEVIKLGLAGKLGPKETLELKIPVYKKIPKVGGFAKQEIPNFLQGTMLELTPLRSQGIAWFEKSFLTRNKGALFFKAKASDEGDIQIFFGNTISLDYQWKIVIGSGNNSKSVIIKRDVVGGVPLETVVAEISKDENPLAVASPGNFVPYWISVDDGQIMVGAGEEMGENMFLAWKDLDQRMDITRYGFGNHLSKASFSEVQVTRPIKIQGPQEFYFEQDSEIQTGSEGLLKNPQIDPNLGLEQDLVFRVPGRGTFVFDVVGQGGEFYFFDDHSGKSFSRNDIEGQKLRILAEQYGLLSKQINSLANVLDLREFFDSMISNYPKEKKEEIKKQISSFFFERDKHALSNFAAATDIPNSKSGIQDLNGFMDKLSSGDKEYLMSFSLEEIQVALRSVVDLFIKQKIKHQAVEDRPALWSEILSIVLGEKKLELPKQKKRVESHFNYWIPRSIVDRLYDQSKEVNNHYRLRIKTLAEVNAQKDLVRQENEMGLKRALSLFSNNLDLDASELSKRLLGLFESQKNEFLTSKAKELSKKLLSKRDELDDLDFVFDPAYREMLAQESMSGQGLACLVLEKYDSSTDDYKELVSSRDQDRAELDIAEGKRFWISFTKGRIFLGYGNDVGENLLLFYFDINNPFEDISKIGFIPTGDTSIQRASLGGPVAVSLEEKKESYRLEKTSFPYEGSVKVISPYEYHVDQADQQVKFKDIISRKTLFPGATPQQGALYYFTLMLQENGFPLLDWTKEPQNKLKLEVDKRAFIKQAEADAYYQASTYVQGMGVLGGLAGVGASIAYSRIGVDRAEEGAELEGLSKTAFRSHDSYVFTDRMSQLLQLASKNIPPQAEENKLKLEETLNTAGIRLGDSKEILSAQIARYNDILGLINHPHVVKNNRERLFSQLQQIRLASELISKGEISIDIADYILLQIFIKAYNNPYLVDVNSSKEMEEKRSWYAQIGEISRRILNNSKDNSLKLSPLYGEYVWLTDAFETPGEGSVSFEAKASSDVCICFSDQPGKQVRNTNKTLYEIVFGAWDNDRTVIRMQSLGKSVKETRNPKSLLNPIQFKKYWVSFNKGRIILGVNELNPENAIGEYDPVTRKVIEPQWNPYSLDVFVHPEWKRLVVGTEDGFLGKDTLQELVIDANKSKKKYEEKESPSDEDKKHIELLSAQIDEWMQLIDEREQQIKDLVSKNKDAYLVVGNSAGDYSIDPFMWQDPYYKSYDNISYVGIGSWDSEVDFRNIQVGPSVENVDLYKDNLIAQIKNQKDMPIFKGRPKLKNFAEKVLNKGKSAFQKMKEKVKSLKLKAKSPKVVQPEEFADIEKIDAVES